jgi:hypothetical protein
MEDKYKGEQEPKRERKRERESAGKFMNFLVFGGKRYAQ